MFGVKETSRFSLHPMAIAPNGWKPRADAGEESVKDLGFVKSVKPSPENDCSSVGYQAYCDLFAV